MIIVTYVIREQFRSTVGTYDKIKVRKLYSHCMRIQWMHTCLIISLHGVVLFFVIIECADKILCADAITAKIQNSTLPWLCNQRGFVAWHSTWQIRRRHCKGSGLSRLNIDQWTASSLAQRNNAAEVGTRQSTHGVTAPNTLCNAREIIEM